MRPTLRPCALTLLALVFSISCDKGGPTASAPPAPQPAPATTKPSVTASASTPETFSGEGLTLVITRAGDSITGTIKLGDQTFPTTGTVAADGSLAGSFQSNGNPFNWTATKNGAELRFKTGDTEYKLASKSAYAADNPLARKPEPNAVTVVTEAVKPPPVVPAKPKTTSNPGGHAIKLKRLSIHDPGINNIEAVSFLVPEGWNSEGGIKWFGDYSVLCNLQLKISDPQSGAQIEFLPIQNFMHLVNPVVPMAQGTNYMGNIIMPPMQDLAEIVAKLYADKATPQLARAKLENREELTKVIEQLRPAWGPDATIKSERLRYAYDYNGKPWQEDVYMTVVYNRGPVGIFWQITSVTSLRAPQGTLDKMTPLMTSVVMSARPSADWYAGYMYVQKLFANRQNQGIANAKAISDTITRNSEEIRKMFADSYREQQASQDRIAQAQSEQIRGVETYRNPYEDRHVELPAGYDNVWVNRQGEYILSDTAGFDPNVGSTVEWSQLKRN